MASSAAIELAAPRSKAYELRAEFPLLSQCVYLNSNSAGAVPGAAKAALDEYWSTIERWRDEVWQRWWPELACYADEIAAFIGAPPGSVVCDTNVATLLGRILTCFDFGERPRLVTTDLEFPSIPFILRGFARYGAETVIVPSLDGRTLDGEHIAAAIDERTQLVCLSHATFATGSLVDVAPIVRRARKVGALVALDVYQSVGAVPIDVAALDVDIVLGGAHKWLCGSYESAFLYVRPSLASRLEPAATGWIASADPLSFAPPTRYAENARRFASGTPAVLPARFSRPGLGIVRALGIGTIRALSLSRTDRIIALADEARLGVASPRAHVRRGGHVALRFPGDEAVARQLVAEGFVCSYRGGIRIAPHFYNTDDEIGCLMAEVSRLARVAS
jgi:kynureninase